MLQLSKSNDKDADYNNDDQQTIPKTTNAIAGILPYEQVHVWQDFDFGKRS